MANAIDYIRWRGDLPFASSKFNEVDAFLFSQISMVDFAGIVPEDGGGIRLQDAAGRYFANHDTNVRNLGVLQAKKCLPAFHLMMNTTRFKDVILRYYVNKISENDSEQFGAVTFELPGEICCVSFRGTDDTIIGWKEDCDLAVKTRVPAQIDALEYVKRVAGETEGKLVLCGHSKGGNLAVYSLLNAPDLLAVRIRKVYSFDGPGFRKEVVSGGRYEILKGRIAAYITQNSLVGILFHRAGRVRILKSSAAGLLAHDGFTWEVLGCRFVRTKKLSLFSETFDRIVNEKIEAMPIGEREEYITRIFTWLFRPGVSTLSDLMKIKGLTELFFPELQPKKKKTLRLAVYKKDSGNGAT